MSVRLQHLLVILLTTVGMALLAEAYLQFGFYDRFVLLLRWF